MSPRRGRVILTALIVAAAVFVAVSPATRFSARGDRGRLRESALTNAEAQPATSSHGVALMLSVDDAFAELRLFRPPQRKPAPDFSAPLTDGNTFRLSDQRDKLILINFWATWCGPCRWEMPAMERLYRRYRDQGFVLIGLSVDRDPKVIPPFAKRYDLTFPIGLDPNSRVGTAYGIRGLPSTAIVDRRGDVAALAVGPRDWDNAAAHALVEGMLR